MVNRSLFIQPFEVSSSESRLAGIGLGITKHLLDQGANVVVADLNAVAGAKVIEELKENASS